MSNFMIGMEGKYDYRKFDRDFRPGFYGIQVCLFEGEEEIKNLSNEAKNNGFSLGIHFPLRAGISKLRDPQFLSLNRDIRMEAFNQIERELKYIRDKHIKPYYILFHYPKPVILKENFDMSNWRFADCSEYIYESDYPYHEFRKLSENLFKWLTEKSLEYNFIPVLEFDALNKYICKDNFLCVIPELLDTGKLV